MTDVAALEGENLVAVRVLNPTDHDIDGLNITNVPNRNKCMKPWAGNGNNIGGLTYPVDMHVVPNVHITDMFVQSDIHTGRMSVDLTLENASGADMCGTIRVDVVDHGGNGESVASRQFRADFVRGGNEYKAELTVDDPVLWDIDDPHLYRRQRFGGDGRGYPWQIGAGTGSVNFSSGTGSSTSTVAASSSKAPIPATPSPSAR